MIFRAFRRISSRIRPSSGDWKIKPRAPKVEATYLTGRMTWRSDYVAILDKEDQKIDLTGWVTLDNKSGATFKNAKLKLVAGM